MDDSSKKTLSSIPLLKTKAGPRDKDLWPKRLKEEYQALIQMPILLLGNTRPFSGYASSVEIQAMPWIHGNVDGWALSSGYKVSHKYVQNNKAADNDWFRLESNKEGTRWFGKCWFIQNMLKYEFDIEFDIPVTFPGTAPEIAIPELDGKTAKMYRGGKICLSDHFKPLWARNVPKFGIAHAMALGLGPWLAVEIPDLIEKGIVVYKEKTEESSSS